MKSPLFVGAGLLGVIALAIASGSTVGRTPFGSHLSHSSVDAIAASEAMAHVGESTRIQGTVSEVFTSRGGTTFVDVDGYYPEQALKAVIFPDSASSVGDLHEFENKDVIISGTIKLYEGEPEIIVTSRDQIQLSP